MPHPTSVVNSGLIVQKSDQFNDAYLYVTKLKSTYEISIIHWLKTASFYALRKNAFHIGVKDIEN